MTITTKLLIKIIAMICLISIKSINAKNILCLVAMPSPSHHIWNKSIMQELANRGHNLTILTVEETEISQKNMNYLIIEQIYEFKEKYFINHGENVTKNNGKIDLSRPTTIRGIIDVYSFSQIIDKLIIKSVAVKKLLNYSKQFKFDLVIHDFTRHQILLGFVSYFGNPPLISISPYNIPPFTNAITGMINFPSYMPYLGAELTNKMSFMDRIRNLFYWAFDWFYREYFYMLGENNTARECFGSDLPSLQSIEANSELVLVNIDWSIDYAQLLPPNVIPVGGLQVKREQPLVNDLAEYINQSKNGVILFSLGTNVKSSHLGSIIYTFLDAFHELKEYDFIWKFENDELENIPENVLIRKFLPQNSILAHPNVKLFMTHGGLLSIQESIWYGVPILGFPIFADQPQNMLKVTETGLGLELNIQNLTVSMLVENIRTIIKDPSYKKRIIKKSKIFRNQPMHPLDRAIFWIENVLENGEAKHLKLGNSHLNIIQLYMLDIFGIFLICLILVIVILMKYCCCWQ